VFDEMQALTAPKQGEVIWADNGTKVMQSNRIADQKAR
jgi:hypothetical protein